MAASSISRYVAVTAAMLLIAVAADSLVPVSLQVRLGLHWLIEHFLAYFILTLVFCLAWPRPALVAVCLGVVAGAIEALQGLTADRIPDPATAFCGAAGVLVAGLLASLVTDLWQTRRGRARTALG